MKLLMLFIQWINLPTKFSFSRAAELDAAKERENTLSSEPRNHCIWLITPWANNCLLWNYIILWWMLWLLGVFVSNWVHPMRFFLLKYIYIYLMYDLILHCSIIVLLHEWAEWNVRKSNLLIHVWEYLLFIKHVLKSNVCKDFCLYSNDV